MSFSRCLAAAALLSFSALPANVRGAEPDVVPLRPLAGGLFAAPVHIGGESLWLLVDTGATRTMLRSEVATRLHLKPRARFLLETTAGSVPGLCAGPVALRVGRTELSVDCLGWSPAADGVTLGAAGIDGVLASDALGGRPLLLDPARALLVLDPSPHEISGLEVPLTLEAGRPTLTMRTAGGTLRLVLDSAAEDLILFGAAAAAVTARRGVGLETMTGARAAAVGMPPRLTDVRRPPRQALLLPDLRDRGEDGLVPLATVGRVALDWQRGVATLAAYGGTTEGRRASRW